MALYRHSCVTNQASGVVRDTTNTEHFAGVPMKPFLDDSDVNIDDVAGLQDFPVTRNTMTDHMINGGAYRFGKSVVVERRRNGSLVVNDVIMAQSVQFAGADSGLHIGPIISSTSAASRPATRIFSISSGFLMWMLMIVVMPMRCSEALYNQLCRPEQRCRQACQIVSLASRLGNSSPQSLPDKAIYGIKRRA